MNTLNSTRGKVISAITGLSLLATSLIAAAPANAASYAMVLSTPSTNVANGSTFVVTLNASTDSPIRAFGANIIFDPAKLQVTSVAYGTFLGDWATANGASTLSGAAYHIDNTAGNLSSLNLALMGGSGGPIGSGSLAVITFHANAAVDAVTAITLNNPRLTDMNLVSQPAPGSPLNMTVGTVPQPDLTVSNVAATGVSSNLSNYNVSFQVNNIGNANAGASNVSIVVDGGAPIIIAVPAIAAGSFVTLNTSSPIAISGTNDNIVVNADSANVIAESNEGNNAASASYSFVPASGATVDVNGNVVPSLNFTQPAAVNFGNFALGNNQVVNTMNVLSNQPWAVNVKGNAPTANGSTDGKMTKWNTGVYTPAVKLHTPLQVVAGAGYMGAPVDPTTPSADYLVNLTGVDQLLATGIPEGQNADGIHGETRNAIFNQTLLGTDSPNTYHIVVSFTASSIY